MIWLGDDLAGADLAGADLAGADVEGLFHHVARLLVLLVLSSVQNLMGEKNTFLFLQDIYC